MRRNNPKNFLFELKTQLEEDTIKSSQINDLKNKEYTLLYNEIKSYLEKLSSDYLFELKLQTIEGIERNSRNTAALIYSLFSLVASIIALFWGGILSFQKKESLVNVPAIVIAIITIAFSARQIIRELPSVFNEYLHKESETKIYLQMKLMCIEDILEERKQSALSNAEFKDKYGSIDLELPL